MMSERKRNETIYISHNGEGIHVSGEGLSVVEYEKIERVYKMMINEVNAILSGAFPEKEIESGHGDCKFILKEIERK